MASSSGSTNPTENLARSLDRAAFNVYDQADRHVVAKLRANQSDDYVAPNDSQETPTSGNDHLNRFTKFHKTLRAKAKTRTEEILHPSRDNDASSESSTAAPCLAPQPSSSTADDRLYNPLPKTEGPDAKDVIKHPISTVQSAMRGGSGAKAAEIMDNQVIPHGANVGLIRACDEAESAQNEQEKNEAVDKIETLKKERQDMYVRWTMDRHVLKVRQDPPRTLERPRMEDYRVAKEEGKANIDWGNYGQQLVRFYAEQYCDQHIDESSDPPPANEEAINTSIERLLMTSMVYQTSLMNVRQIYRWDDPNKTGMYCVAYFLLVLYGHLGSGVIFWVLLLVVRRWYYPPTPEGLREDIKRSENTEKTALNVSQLIEQHGSRGWLDALIEKMGPKAMLQLEDMADALEILRNFYEWRDPPRTARTLGALAACLLLFTVCPLWLLVRGTQFNFGVMFFGVFPITSKHPQFRHLVSPFKWAFWKISTDSEWAIARIQAEADQTTKAMKGERESRGRSKGASDSKPTQDDDDDDDNDGDAENSSIYIGRSHCTTMDSQKRLHHGHIIVTSKEVKFETAIRSKALWTLQWKDVSAISKARTDDALCFEVGEEEKYKVEKLKGRNVLFTQIIGYSGLKWQVSD